MAYSKYHVLAHSVYMETKRLVKSYPKLIAEYEEIMGASSVPDGQPRGSGIGHPTEQTALKLMDVSIKLDAIHKSLNHIPEGYRWTIFNHIVFRKPWTQEAGISTWRLWQYRYVYYVRQFLLEKGIEI